MSLTASLTSALSGLAAASRGAETISNNIANAATPGYGRRELVLSAQALGGRGLGVAVSGTLREADAALIGDRRRAQAAEAAAGTLSTGATRLDAALGAAGEDGSLTALLARLEGAVTDAAGRPDNALRLADLRDAAVALATGLNAAGAAVQDMRAAADRAVAADVALLDTTLGSIATLNTGIARLTLRGEDASTLIDQRQALVDRIAPIVPLREVARPNGVIALFTPTGGVLLDGRTTRFGFVAAGAMTPGMTLAGGALAAVMADGRPQGTGADGTLAGGRLAANLALRDSLGPQAQAELDSLARDLIERLSAPAADPTLAPGAPGLFTDGGAAVAPGAPPGLAQRIAVNTVVDPAAGGALWRLRDGLGATAAGDPGAAVQLLRLAAALTDARPTAGTALPAGDRSAAALAGDVASAAARRRLGAEDEAGFTAARAAALRGAEAARGVDTDRELQDLLRVERAYAANARVIQAVDRMFETLLGV